MHVRARERGGGDDALIMIGSRPDTKTHDSRFRAVSRSNNTITPYPLCICHIIILPISEMVFRGGAECSYDVWATRGSRRPHCRKSGWVNFIVLVDGLGRTIYC